MTLRRGLSGPAWSVWAEAVAWLAIAYLLLLFLSIWLGSLAPNLGCDWYDVYKPAAHLLWQGKTPYELPGRLQFYNPPWALVLLTPFALLPRPYDLALLMLVSMIVTMLVNKQMGGSRIGLLVLCASPFFIGMLLYGQIDWLVLLGLVLPPWAGLLFVMIKPQVGAGVAIYWLIRTWREEGHRAMFMQGLASALFLIVSFLLYGLWPLRWLRLSQAEACPWSIWPLGLPIGCLLLYYALRKCDNGRNLRAAICAAPCLSTHLWVHSLMGVGATLVDDLPALAIFVGSLWLLAFMGATA